MSVSENKPSRSLGGAFVVAAIPALLAPIFLTIRAGGAVLIFTIIFFVNPPKLIHQATQGRTPIALLNKAWPSLFGGHSPGAFTAYAFGGATLTPTPGADIKFVQTAAAFKATGSSPPAWPIKVASGGRYLTDANGSPFFLWSDTTWNLFTSLPLTGAVSASTYFADRAARGFNCVYCPLLSGLDASSTSQANFATYDGILPFTQGSAKGDGKKNNYNIAAPNSAYFNRIVAMVNLAAQYGLTVILNVYENDGWEDNFVRAGVSKVQTLGAYIGGVFASCPNIIYNYGNDYQDWQTNSASEAAMAALEAGIKSADGSHIHLGAELNFINSTTFDDSNWTGLDANCVYSYYPMYVEDYHGYSQSTKPIFMIESTYEAECYSNNTGYYYIDDGGPYPSGTFSTQGSAVVRRQVLWGLTSGLAGFNYGNWWTADNTSTSTSWVRNLNASAGNSGSKLVSILQAHHWWKLAPDTSHTFVTAGYGTQRANPGIVVGDLPAPKNAYGTVPGDTFCTAELASDGSFGIVYLPRTSTVTVSLAGFSGPVQAQWMDPVSGALTTVSGSPFGNSGTHRFTSLGTNSDGTYTDWVLLLTSGAGGSLTPTATRTPTATQTPTGTLTPTPPGTPTPNRFATSCAPSIRE